eukprot:5771845-Pyramimonas_sp.AAC.1
MSSIRHEPHRIGQPAVFRHGKFAGMPGQCALPAQRIDAPGKRANWTVHVEDQRVLNARMFAPNVAQRGS